MTGSQHETPEWRRRALAAEAELAGTTKRIRDRVLAQIRDQMLRNSVNTSASAEALAQQRLARYHDNLVQLLTREFGASYEQAERAASRVEWQSWVEPSDAPPIQVVNAGSPGLGKRR